MRSNFEKFAIDACESTVHHFYLMMFPFTIHKTPACAATGFFSSLNARFPFFRREESETIKQ